MRTLRFEPKALVGTTRPTQQLARRLFTQVTPTPKFIRRFGPALAIETINQLHSDSKGIYSRQRRRKMVIYDGCHRFMTRHLSHRVVLNAMHRHDEQGVPGNGG
jgi:hypothetical protein